tara:strand:+ start:2626 stop:2871 length:246 start_codon:yes stop_codon:yes gene_type:complete
MATNEKPEPTISFNNNEYKLADLSVEQRYFYSQVNDLRNQQYKVQFQLDQVNASLLSFEQKLVGSLQAMAEQVETKKDKKK